MEVQKAVTILVEVTRKLHSSGHWLSSREQPTRGGPPAWGMGEVLTTPLRKKHMSRTTHKLRCFLWRQNNPEVQGGVTVWRLIIVSLKGWKSSNIWERR